WDPECIEVSHRSQFIWNFVDIDSLVDERCWVKLARFDHVQHLTVARRLETERAVEVDLLGDEVIDRQLNHPFFFGSGQPDLNVRSSLAEAVDCILTCGFDTKSVGGDICSTVSDILDFASGIVDFGSVNRSDRTKFFGLVEV